MTWYIVRSATRQENRAVGSLREAGFTTYLPEIIRWERRGHAKERAMMHRPLFPGYLFVRIPAGNFWAAEAADGVSGLLRYTTTSGERAPREAAVEIVTGLQQIIASGEHDDATPLQEQPVNPGQRVRVTAGKYGGCLGQIKAARGHKRVQVLLDAVARGGWPWKVEIPMADLEAVA